MSFWAMFLSIAIIGTITWLDIFEHNYHPRIYRLNEDLPERSASGGREGEGIYPSGGELGSEVPLHAGVRHA